MDFFFPNRIFTLYKKYYILKYRQIFQQFQATMMACKELLNRLEPIKKEMENPSWQNLVLTAHLKDVDLCARHMYVYLII